MAGGSKQASAGGGGARGAARGTTGGAAAAAAALAAGGTGARGGVAGAAGTVPSASTLLLAEPFVATPKKGAARGGDAVGGPAATPRKSCNCRHSKCLKLYCECFASGVYCVGCNCSCCMNNKEHESTRKKAIELTLERRPNAFRPKIASSPAGAAGALAVRHNKGCACKKSGCLKRYCECFQANILCGDNCKCVGCKNCKADGDEATTPARSGAASAHSTPSSVASSAASAKKQALQGSDGAQTPQRTGAHSVVTVDGRRIVLPPAVQTKRPLASVLTDDIVRRLAELLAYVEYSGLAQLDDDAPAGDFEAVAARAAASVDADASARGEAGARSGEQPETTPPSTPARRAPSPLTASLLCAEDEADQKSPPSVAVETFADVAANVESEARAFFASVVSRAREIDAAAGVGIFAARQLGAAGASRSAPPSAPPSAPSTPPQASTTTTLRSGRVSRPGKRVLGNEETDESSDDVRSAGPTPKRARQARE